MATWLKIVLGVIVVIAALIGGVMYATSGVTRAADEFIKAGGSGDMASARSHLTDAFQARTDEAALGRFIVSNGLATMQEGKWSSRGVDNGRGNLVGTIVTASGSQVPVSIALAKEHGAWKLQSINVSQVGLDPGQAGTRKPELPDSATKLKLLKRTMRDFALSANQGDMAYFRSTTAAQFQREFGTDALNATFGPFMEHGDRFLSLSGATPTPTSAPSIGEDGAMTLEGYYPVGSKRVAFTERYIPEDDDWKLIQFSLEVMDAPVEPTATLQGG